MPGGAASARGGVEVQSGTQQSEVLNQRKFLEGTYAARVKFSDAPVSGPDGDAIVETFFTITPINRDLDPDYSEQDFEYLPNGGWSEPSSIMYAASWETYQNEPWQAVNVHGEIRQSYDGWHDNGYRTASTAWVDTVPGA
jgi:hypothetical protein